MLGNAMGGLSGVGSIVAVVGIAGLDKFEQDLGRMSRAVDGQAQFMRKSMNVAAAAGVVSFMLSIDAAMKFESAFAGVVKTTDGLSDEFGRLNSAGKELAGQFRALALEVPISVNELARIGELGGQLGIPKEELISFTETIANLGKTTNLSIEEGSTSIARFINITKNVAPAGMVISEQAERIGSTVVDLGNKMATTEAEIVAFAMRIAGAGGQVGMSQEKILAFGAALSSVGLNAEAGGTAISRLFIEMANTIGKGGARLEEFAKIAKMSTAEFAAAFKEDAADAALAFLSGLNDMSKAGENIYPVLGKLDLSEIRLRDTITRSATARDILNKAIVWGTDAYRENNAMTAEAQKRYETFESQMQLVKSIFNEAFIQLGENLLPALKSFTSAAKDNAGEIAAFVSVLGGAVMVLGTAALAMKGYRIAAELATLASRAFASSLGPVGLAIAALGGAYYLYNRYAAEAWKSENDLQKLQTERSAKIKELTDRYDELTKNEGLSYAHQAEIRDVARQLRDAYAEAGIKVSSFGKSALDEYNQYIERIRPRLVDELDKLKKRNEYYLAASGADSGGAAFKKSMESGVFDTAEIQRGFAALRNLREETGLLSEEEKRAAEVARELAKAEADKIRQQELAAAATEALKEKRKALSDWEKYFKEHLFDTRIEMQRYIDQVTAAPLPIGELVGSTHLLDYTITEARGDVRGLGDEFVAAAFKAGNELNPVLKKVEIKMKSAKEEAREFSRQLRAVVDVTGSLAQAVGGKIGGALDAMAKGIESARGGIVGVASFYITTIGNVIKQDKQIADHREKIESLRKVWSDLGTTSKEVLDIMQEVVSEYQSPYLERLIDDVKYFENLDQLSKEALAVYRSSLESLKLVGGALAGDLAMSTALENMRFLNDEYRRMEDYYGAGSVAKMAPQFYTLLTEAMDSTRKAMYRFNEETQRYELIIDKNSKAYKELGAEMYRMYLIAQENGWLAYGDFSAITRGLSGDLEAWKLAFEELYGAVDDATQSLRDFAVEADKAFSTISDKFDNFESSAKEVTELLERMAYLKIDIDTTELDENIIASMQGMYKFIGTLDPDSEAWKDADAYFQNMMTLLNQIGYSWTDIYKLFGMPLPNINPQSAPVESKRTDPERAGSVSGSVKIPVIWRDDPGSQEYWERVLEGIDEAYYSKYNEVQERLTEAKADLEELRAGAALQLAEIDKEYNEKIRAKISERTEVEAALYDLLGKRAELVTGIQLKTAELKGDATEIRSFLRIMGEKTDLTVLRDVEDAVARITGKTRDFTTGWDEMLTKLAGGQNEEFDKTTEAIGAASKALEEALYYGEDIDGTPFEDRINSLIWSAQNFANELNPDSQAFKDAQAAIGALTTKFYQAGGTMDKEAAAEAAKKWAEEMAAAAEKEAAEIEEKGGFQLLKLDLDIAGIREQIDKVNEEIGGLFEAWEQERLEVELDISKAEANIARLRQELRDLRNDWYSDKFYLWIESGGAVGSDRRPTSVYAYAEGGFVGSTQLALVHENEFVLNPDAVAALGRDKLENFNAAADPRALTTIDRSVSGARSSRAQDKAQSMTVVVREAMPSTWVEITDKRIHPRVSARERKYKVGSNPYARR